MTASLDNDGKGGALPPSEDRAVVNGAGQAVSALRASVPSAFGISSSACFCPEEDSPEQFDGQTITWTFEVLKTEYPGPGLYELVKVRNLTAEERSAKSATLLAQAIEARRAETERLGAKHESAVRQDAPNPEGKAP